MTDQIENEPEYQGWALLEIMGHRKTAGLVKEVQMAGATLLRVDVPKPDSDDIAITQYYGGGSIYCMTPCTEESARQALQSKHSLPSAVQLALPTPETEKPREFDFDEDYPEY